MLGGTVEITLYDFDEVMAETLFDDIYRELLRLQNIFNFYDDKSELSLLNKKRKMNVSNELLEVIKMAISFCKETDGAYDITKGREFLARKEGKKIICVACSYKDIKIIGNTIELLHEDAMIDLGSVAKGYIGDRIAEFIKVVGVKAGFVDLRGDMICFGNREELIEIMHPRNKDATIHPFKLKNMAVATSGDYLQYAKDFDECHILGKQDIISATVVAKTLAEADICATCVFVLGKDKAKDFLRKHKNMCIIIDTEQKESIYNS
jgi:FAD:protein FMN transferase